MKRFVKFLLHLLAFPLFITVVGALFYFFISWLSKYQWFKDTIPFVILGSLFIFIIVSIVGIVKEAWIKSGKD